MSRSRSVRGAKLLADVLAGASHPADSPALILRGGTGHGAAPMTLSADLERDRLEARAVRLDRVIAALRARARAYDAVAVPRPLRQSLTDFHHELDAVRERLGNQRHPITDTSPQPAGPEQAIR